MAGPSLMETLFQRSLEDLIKGLRLHGGAESTFISKAVDEIRREIKFTDPQTKATALQKLTYLHSLHAVDMSFAAFNSVELSSSAVFHSKRAAYLAASLSFDPSTTDVILLLTNQLRKDLNSSNPHEVSLALHTLAFICNSDLARDLTPEVFNLLNSSKNFVKKKAIATVLRVFEKYPDAVRVCFKRLVENLESSDVGVVSAVVGVFCELAGKEPRSYLPLAPEFYKILVDSRNNWVLIKVLKIFAKLAPLEPRLGKRVVEPICEHLRRTGAKSLSYECIKTIVSCLNEYESAVKLAVDKIREFMIDDDPNLKYLGLQALTIVAPKHLWAVLENKDVVIKSLSDTDVNVKLQALQLVMAMVSDDNLAEICKVLINYALKSDPEFCNEILGSILSTCSRNFYEVVIDFDWYVSLLGEMSRIPHCQKGEQIEYQLVDIGTRVKDVRPELVRVSRDLLIDPALLGNNFIHRILSAAAWVSGEYVEFSKNPVELMEALLQPRISLLPPPIRSVYIQSAFKVLSFCMYTHLLHDAIASSSSEVTNSFAEEDYVGSCSLETNLQASGVELDEGLNPRTLRQPLEDISSVNSQNIAVTDVKTSSISSRMNHISRESLLSLLNLVTTTVGPLTRSHEVEIQERARNVVGLVALIQQEMPEFFDEKSNKENVGFKVDEIIKLMHAAFSEELGPVSASAQERVPLPDGLVLKENLNDLEEICGDIKLPIPSSFVLGRTHPEEKEIPSVVDCQTIQESGLSTESTSLLAEHRKRHGLYYLPSEDKVHSPGDYPPANDPSTRYNVNNEMDDLVKLTEQSLILKKKPHQSKPRPVVVKLDDVGGKVNIASKLVPKDDLVSDAVRDVLLGNEAIASSSRTGSTSKPKGKRRGSEKSNVDKSSGLKEDLGNTESSVPGMPNSRRSKHRTHSKEKKQEKDKHDKDEQKGSHLSGRQRSRQRGSGSTIVEAQSPVIPDFLL